MEECPFQVLAESESEIAYQLFFFYYRMLPYADVQWILGQWILPVFPVSKPIDNTTKSKLSNLSLILSIVIQPFEISHKVFLQVGILLWGIINWSKFQFPISKV